MEKFLLGLLIALLFAQGAEGNLCPDSFSFLGAAPLQSKRELQSAIFSAEERLGFSLSFRETASGIYAFGPSGKRIGGLSFSFPKKKTFDIDDINVVAESRRKGVAEALFAQALLRHPKIKKIKTPMLVLTNGDALKEALAKGLSCVEAIKLTPAYRMRARFGFTEIAKADCILGSFTSARP